MIYGMKRPHVFFEKDLSVMEVESITSHKSMEKLSRYTYINADKLADKLAHLSALASWRLWSCLIIDTLMLILTFFFSLTVYINYSLTINTVKIIIRIGCSLQDINEDSSKIITPLFLIISFPAYAGEMLEGRVVGVHDGDTVTLLMVGNQLRRS